jgi:hypothetical protein
MKTRLADLQALLSGHVPEGRKLLRLLFEEPIKCGSRQRIQARGNRQLSSPAAHLT